MKGEASSSILHFEAILNKSAIYASISEIQNFVYYIKL